MHPSAHKFAQKIQKSANCKKIQSADQSPLSIFQNFSIFIILIVILPVEEECVGIRLLAEPAHLARVALGGTAETFRLSTNPEIRVISSRSYHSEGSDVLEIVRNEVWRRVCRKKGALTRKENVTAAYRTLLHRQPSQLRRLHSNPPIITRPFFASVGGDTAGLEHPHAQEPLVNSFVVHHFSLLFSFGNGTLQTHDFLLLAVVKNNLSRRDRLCADTSSRATRKRVS